MKQGIYTVIIRFIIYINSYNVPLEYNEIRVSLVYKKINFFKKDSWGIFILDIHTCVYIYIYIYIYVHTYYICVYIQVLLQNNKENISFLSKRY